MKLLLDQNIPRRLVSFLQRDFPGSTHVTDVGLATASDNAVWEFAIANGFAIVSKDADFHHMSFLFGAPPKTVWIRLGNCTTAEITACLFRQAGPLQAFLSDPEAALLILGDS